MTTTTLTKASLRLVLGCSVALFFAANMDAASAHGGGHSSGSNGNHGSDHSDHHDHDYDHHDQHHHDHHHHDHHSVGPISGGSPPTYHPPVVKIPVSGVATTHLPGRPCVGECAPVRLCNGVPCRRGGR